MAGPFRFNQGGRFRNFRNFSVNPRWRPVVKHRQNVGKPSFRKLTMEMPVEVTPRTALSNFVRVRCEFFDQFRRLVRTKIRPSSIIIRLHISCTFSFVECVYNESCFATDVYKTHWINYLLLAGEFIKNDKVQ